MFSVARRIRRLTSIALHSGCRRNFVSRCCSVWCLTLFPYLVAGGRDAAAGEYRISVGEAIEVDFGSGADLRRKYTVQADGAICLPWLGNVAVAGMKPAEALSRVQAGVAAVSPRIGGGDGRRTAFVDPSQVTLSVVEYKPLYVSGFVLKPGEQPFRPGTTIRQALAVAGGLGSSRVLNSDDLLRAIDLRSELRKSEQEFIRSAVRAWRVKAELGLGDKLDRKELAIVHLPAEQVEDIIGREAELMRAQDEDRRRGTLYLQSAVKQAEEHISVLSAQRQQEEQGAEADVRDLQRAVDAFGSGSIPSPRVADARRAVLLSATRKLQTASQLLQVKRQRDDFARQLEHAADERRISLIQELQDVNAKSAALRISMASAAEKLTQLAGGTNIGQADEPDVSYFIVRQAAGQSVEHSEKEDFELQPGDSVVVKLRLNQGRAG